MPTPDTCRCVSVRDALRLAVAEQAIPICPDHDEPATPPTTPLNSSELTDALRATVGAAGNVTGSFSDAFRDLLNHFENTDPRATAAHH